MGSIMNRKPDWRRLYERERMETLPAPDPKNFRLEKVETVGSSVIAIVHYPDATNFEGRKIIVFQGTTEEEIRERDEIDPHFDEAEDKEGRIIARLLPDEEGWEIALGTAALADQIHQARTSD